MKASIPGPLKIIHNLSTTTDGKALDAYRGNFLNSYLLDTNTNQIAQMDNTVFGYIDLVATSSNVDRGILFCGAGDEKIARIFMNDSNNTDLLIHAPQIFFLQYSANTNSSYFENYCFRPAPAGNNSLIINYPLLDKSSNFNSAIFHSESVVSLGISFYYTHYSSWVQLFSRGRTSSTVAASKTFFTLPVGYRPIRSTYAAVTQNGRNKSSLFTISSNGNVVTTHSLASSTYIYFNTMFFTAQTMGLYG